MPAPVRDTWAHQVTKSNHPAKIKTQTQTHEIKPQNLDPWTKTHKIKSPRRQTLPPYRQQHFKGEVDFVSSGV